MTGRSTQWTFRAAAVLPALVLCLSATASSAAVGTCRAEIAKHAQKLEASLSKALARCADGYDKARAMGKALALQAAPTCQATLRKAVDVANPSSAIAKAKAALDESLITGRCDDATLFGLGHLPSGTFGDRWARLVLLASIQQAYDTQNLLLGDLQGVMSDLAASGCPACAPLTGPPCVTRTCSLGGLTGGTVFAGLMPAAVTITGHLSFGLCEFPGVLSDEIGVIGGPSRTVQAAVNGVTVCPTTLRTRGIINCAGGTAPTVGFRTCQDSSLSDGDQCPAPAPGAICLPAAAPNTGPACTTFVTSEPAPGQSFGLSAIAYGVSSASGADGVSCTSDDTYLATRRVQVPLSTHLGAVTVHNVNDSPSPRALGEPGFPGPDCARVRAGDLAGGYLIGVFPDLDSPLGDTVGFMLLACE